MIRIIICFILLNIWQYIEAGDANWYNSTTVYTCKNGSVVAGVLKNQSYELTSSEKTALKNALISPTGQYAYLGLTANDIIGDASTAYNCHAYAWHLTEGNTNNVWINNSNGYKDLDGCYISNGNLDKYWSSTYGCFYETTEANAEKIHYYCGDHSAVKSKTHSGKYESKWGDYPLVRHNPTQVINDYKGSYRRYYVKPVIAGVKDLCKSWTYTFTVTNAPAGFTWDKSSNLTLTGTGNSVTVSATGGSSGWISIKLGTTELIRRYVSVSTGSPVFDYIEGPDEVTVSSLSYSWQAHFDNYSTISYSWSVGGTPSSWYICHYYSSSSIDICFLQPAYYLLQVTGENACGTGYGSMNIDVSNPYPYSSAYPNPASNILNVEIDQDAYANSKVSAQKVTNVKTLPSTVTYDIRLYDNMGNMLRRTTTKGGKVEFNVANLPNGIYVLHIYDGSGDKPDMRQIVVEH